MHTVRNLGTVLLALLFATVGGPVPDRVSRASAAEPIIGPASVIDGDTIEIHGRRIRLHGIDAPEGGQTCTDAGGHTYRCGTLAANALDAPIANTQPVRCEPRDIDRYGRTVAVCFTGAQELDAWLVRNGHALDYPRYGHGAYAGEQGQATAAKAGMWRGGFIPPWEWRAERR